jgi:hypothetical protein
MRTQPFFSAFFFFSLFTIASLEAQNPEQLSRVGKQAGKTGADTLSQQFIIDYQVLPVLDSITILSPNDTIILRPDLKGKTVIVDGKPVFKKWNDILVLPNTKGATIPGGIKRNGQTVTKLQICFWPADEEGPRDDLWLDFAAAANGNFIFAPQVGAKVKLGQNMYTVIKSPGFEPLTVNITEKEYEPTAAKGREAIPEEVEIKKKNKH